MDNLIIVRLFFKAILSFKVLPLASLLQLLINKPVGLLHHPEAIAAPKAKIAELFPAFSVV
jgi:hypothetical protein